MKILVTGGAGFIGSNFIRYMLGKYRDYEVVNYDKLTYAGNLDNLKDVEKTGRYTFVKGDIADAKAVSGAIKGCEMAVNFAAETHVDRSIHSAGSFVQTDVVGTYVLLEAVKEFGVKRFLHISTDEVYGSIDKGSFKEDSPFKPNSPYSASKAGGELLVRSYFVTYGLPILIIRASNNFGPYQYPEKMIPLFVTNLLEGKKVPVYGDGMNVRDWLYVIDNCEALDLVLHQGRLGEAYNIGAGNEIPNIQMTKSILKHLGKGEDMITYVKDRPGHDRRYSVDTSKIKKELGWKPRHDFEQAVEETVNWYKENEKWWKDIKHKQAEFKEFYDKQYK